MMGLPLWAFMVLAVVGILVVLLPGAGAWFVIRETDSVVLGVLYFIGCVIGAAVLAQFFGVGEAEAIIIGFGGGALYFTFSLAEAALIDAAVN